MNDLVPDFEGDVPLSRCPGCRRAFSDSLPVALRVPHLVNFTDEDNPIVTTRIPLCYPCARLWIVNDDFQTHCDRVAVSWLKMDDLLRKAEADALQ